MSTVLHEYDWALVRIVPRVHLGTFLNVGVLLHARTAGFIGMRYRLDEERLRALCSEEFDLPLVARHLEAYEHICRGGTEYGPIGSLPASERFHWLTAPRSAVLQTSELHTGRTADPEACLEHLFRTCIG